MKKLFPIFLIVILSLSKDIQCLAQNYADKAYYLVDSLDLSELSTEDKTLIDSCLNIYHKVQEDTSKIKAINVIVEESWDNNVWPKYNMWVFKTISQVLKKSKNKEVNKNLKIIQAGAINNIGYWHDHYGSISSAIIYYHKSLSKFEELKDKNGMGNAYNNIASIYERQGNIPQALEYYQRSLKIRTTINDQRGMAESYNNIGVIHNKQGNKELALKYYQYSLDIKEKLEDKIGLGYAYNNIGYFYFDQKNFDFALKYYFKSLEIRESINQKRGIAETYNNIGLVYEKQNNYKSALESYKKSLQINEEIGDKEGIATICINIGSIELLKKNNLEANKQFERAYNLSNELGYPEIISKSSLNLSYLFQNNNPKKALELYKVHIQMRDSINNESTQKATAQQQAKYEYEKQKAVDDAEHEKQIAIEQEAKEKQQVITYATAGGLGLVGIFLIFVFNRLQVTKRQKNIIEEQKQEVETQKAEVEQAHNELEEKNQEILDSINYAKRIQNAILPPQKVVKEYLQESFILYKPKDIVAGDFYWMERSPSPTLPKGKGVSPPSGELERAAILFAAADCTGHGVPGAMVSVVCNNGLNRSVREYGLTDPGEILNKTREIVIAEFEKSEEEVKDGMDIALCSLKLQTTNNKQQTTAATLQYAGANNPLWIIRKDSEEIEEIKADKQPIGKYVEPTPYTTHSIELQKGDSIYIFSDGYADQFGGEKGKKLKTANFKKLLLSIQNESMEKQKQLIDEAFEKWKGKLEQLDDVCVIGVRI